MRRATSLSSSFSWLLGLALVAACAAPDASSGPAEAAPAPPATTTPEGPAAEAPPAAASNASNGALDVLGATADGGVALARGEGDTRSLELFDVTTGATTVLLPRFGATGKVTFSDHAIAVWADVDAGAGDLSVWTRARGLVHVAASALTSPIAFSADGHRLAWLARKAPDLADLTAADLGSAPSVVVPDVVTNADACTPVIALARDRLFASTCARGESTPTLRTSDGSVATTIAPTSGAWSVDAEGKKLLVVSPTGTLGLRTVPGATSTTIDPLVAWVRIADDGSSAIYRTRAGALKHAVLSGKLTTSTVAASGIDTVVAISPGFDDVFTSSSAPDASNPLVVRRDLAVKAIPHLNLIPTPTLPTTLVATPTALALGFTSGGGRALYVSDVPKSGLPVGTLKSLDVGLSGKEQVLAPHALSAVLHAASDVAVYADDPKQAGDALVSVDLYTVATDGRAAPELVASGAGPTFAVTDAGIVYTLAGRVAFRSLK